MNQEDSEQNEVDGMKKGSIIDSRSAEYRGKERIGPSTDPLRHTALDKSWSRG